jgi:hypothetical protein
MLSAGYAIVDAIVYALGRLIYMLAMQLRYFLLILSTVCQASPSWRSGKSPQSILEPSICAKQTNNLDTKQEEKTKHSLEQIVIVNE